ncbi:MAG: hypothetical protein K2X27_21105 [Candidatus Obscuribacterales bacterium]|nr:hypothetical protein [Candidatus Obscuribacterales bacterium]
MDDEIRRWSQRAEIAESQGQIDLLEAIQQLISMLNSSSKPTNEISISEFLARATLLRKKIEAGEQHRTMCVEHGLSDAAIDETYEIQALEKALIELIKKANIA